MLVLTGINLHYLQWEGGGADWGPLQEFAINTVVLLTYRNSQEENRKENCITVTCETLKVNYTRKVLILDSIIDHAERVSI